MDLSFTFILYCIMTFLLFISFAKDKNKTKLSLRRAWTMFKNMLSQFIAILMIVSLILALVTPKIIQNILGTDSGFRGMALSSVFGSITLVPVLVAFPVASELLKNGAGIEQVAVFISTLTMVGIVTIPVEIKYLGKKVAITRNILAFLFAFLTAIIIGVVLS